jgi:GTP-binding protein YchF
MSLSVGIVGLPNVGKSTLFNALLQKQAALAANYPFATIEPNVGVVPVPDERLPKLAEVVHTSKIVPATVEFYDIAGLVKGASTGAGLGNKFLSHIRETSLIAHVLRAFRDDNILREGSVDPKSDYDTIETELQLADLSTLEKQIQPKGALDNAAKARWDSITKWKAVLNEGKSLRHILDPQDEDTQRLAKELALLSAKPQLIVANVGEEELPYASEIQTKLAGQLGLEAKEIVIISARLEAELAEIELQERMAFMSEYGQAQTGLEAFIARTYEKLGLQSFYTAGELEARAWTIPQGTSAQEAAGVIHTDFSKKFISAQVMSYADFIRVGGWKAGKEQGLVRQEGRGYLMRPDDVVEFMIGR